VCSEENVSVDIEKMTPAQSKAGHQVRSQAGTRGGRKRS
jgi:hypothetical protein